jgi:hypothetical protein
MMFGAYDDTGPISYWPDVLGGFKLLHMASIILDYNSHLQFSHSPIHQHIQNVR